MIYEYAVSPHLFGNRENLALLFQAFEAGSGRLISDYPRRKWIQYVRAFIKESIQEESERNAWIELLIKIQRYTLFERQGPIWDDQEKGGWIANAIKEHHRRPFRGILNDKKTIGETDVIPIGVSMYSHSKWEAPSTRSVPRLATDMVQSVADLINMSTSLILVDRNFNPADGRFSNVLVAFSNYLINSHTHQPRISQIKFVTTYEQEHCNKTKNRFEKRCREFLSEILPYGIEVKFYLKMRSLLHPRFVLTNRGGINFEYGLDEGDGEVIISRLSVNVFEKQWAQWDKKVVHDFIVAGSKRQNRLIKEIDSNSP